MHAIQVRGDTLTWEAMDALLPASGEVRIRVVAAGVNRADLVQRAGAYPPPSGASSILGLEVSGVVDAVGTGTSWSVGDPVCALLAGGGYASHAVVHGDLCLPVPDGVSLVDAAGLPEVWATAWLNLVELGCVASGERVVLHAGASGVGTAAIQLCRLRGARVFVTVGSAAKLETCLALGADAGADRHDGDWVPGVLDWAGGADVILDPVGGGYLEGAQKVLDVDGRWVLIGLMGGRSTTVDLGRLLMKRQRLIGSTLRALSVPRKAAVLRGLRSEVWPALSSGAVSPVIHARIPIQEVERAHALLAGNGTVGKLVLTVAADG